MGFGLHLFIAWYLSEKGHPAVQKKHADGSIGMRINDQIIIGLDNLKYMFPIIEKYLDRSVPKSGAVKSDWSGNWSVQVR